MVRYEAIDSKLFIENRKRFVKQLKPNSVAILNSNDEMPYSGDTNFPFKQNADLFYLSGIDQEQSILVLYPNAAKEDFKELLFLRKTNEQIAVWEGHKYSKEEAQQTSGIKKVAWLEDFDMVFNEIMNHADHCYLNLNENDRFASNVPYRDLRSANELKAKYPAHSFERIGPIMSDLRAIKSDIEIELTKKACGITKDAFIRVLEMVRPEVYEYEIEAEITHQFISNCSDHAYTPIIASGKNSCVLHYIDNCAQCKDGDILLFDFGAQYANYASDMSRTIPVNGTFSDRQKEVYNAVLRVHNEAKIMLRPGTILDDYQKEICKIMEEELIGLGLFTKEDVEKQDPEKPLFKKYFMHGTSHFMGLDVHDIGDRTKPIQPGMIFTCEPGIYIPDEAIGIRLENDFLVTDGDPINLMADIPIEIEEIESIMAKSKIGV
ncbi:MAG: aminopeptidase P family protein [Bacteroidia bacterium]|nr:aminopeptidase P family protein [Bacteroidia bacterium]